MKFSYLRDGELIVVSPLYDTSNGTCLLFLVTNVIRSNVQIFRCLIFFIGEGLTFLHTEVESCNHPLSFFLFRFGWILVLKSNCMLMFVWFAILQSNPGWGFDKKCQFMDKLVWEVSQHYKWALNLLFCLNTFVFCLQHPLLTGEVLLQRFFNLEWICSFFWDKIVPWIL